jgi:hypothetical protein
VARAEAGTSPAATGRRRHPRNPGAFPGKTRIAKIPVTDRSTSALSDDALHAAEAALRAAQFTNDTAALERLLDDALAFTGPDGAIHGKGDDLQAHRERWLRLTRLEPSEERIQRFGSIAVVTVRMDMAGRFKGSSFAGPYRYTRVWCARPDGWRIVAGHVSAVLV